MDDGQHWQTDINTVCTCTSGKVTCQTNIRGKDLLFSFIYLFVKSAI